MTLAIKSSKLVFFSWTGCWCWNFEGIEDPFLRLYTERGSETFVHRNFLHSTKPFPIYIKWYSFFNNDISSHTALQGWNLCSFPWFVGLLCSWLSCVISRLQSEIDLFINWIKMKIPLFLSIIVKKKPQFRHQINHLSTNPNFKD